VSGHVFHPGHDELHGVTVVINGASGRTYLGRWHERGARGITMKDVAIHDPATNPLDVAAWLAKQAKFGVAAIEKMIIIPNDETGPVRVFGEAS
jgi:hypothetical protein